MLSTSSQHPYTACVEFAIQLASNLSDYNLIAIQEMIDANKTELPLDKCFPRPSGYSYCNLIDADEWEFRVNSVDQSGFLLDVQIPLDGSRMRYTVVRFKMERNADSLFVNLWEALPHEPFPKLDLENMHVKIRPEPNPNRDKS